MLILYGCSAGTNFKEVLAIVQKINASNVQINYDTGNAIMENDTDYDLLTS
jgi:dihydroxyacetone kinase DhaKLM complex PTS-EIIA-like component DhaM